MLAKIKNRFKYFFYLIIDEYFESKIKNQKLKFKKIGQNVVIQEPCVFTNCDCIEIGNNVSFAGFVHIWGGGGVVIGDNVMIASHTAITSITHNKTNLIFNSENILAKVIIGNNVWIGAHTIIVPGITIGDNCVIGAGSFVNRNIPPNTIYAGTPVRHLQDLNQFSNK